MRIIEEIQCSLRIKRYIHADLNKFISILCYSEKLGKHLADTFLSEEDPPPEDRSANIGRITDY